MVVRCEEVWREVSNYLDGEMDPGLRAAIDEHVRACKECAAVVNGVRNVIEIYGDERMLEVPLGYSQRLQRHLGENMPGNRRTFLGWMIAAAAACLIVGTLEAARFAGARDGVPLSAHAQPGNGVPPHLNVLASQDGRLFHLAGCTFIHDRDKALAMTAGQATQEGYTPCVRCLKKYLEIT